MNDSSKVLISMHPIEPCKNSRCAVVVPYYTNPTNPIERFCLSQSVEALKENNDIYFLCPIGMEPSHGYTSVTNIIISSNHLCSVESYCRWLLEPELYTLFIKYDRLLILQFDAIVLRDELQYWAAQPYDFIGAPWFDMLIFRPSFRASNYPKSSNDRLDVGNGGLCMINPRSFLYLQSKYKEVFSEFSVVTGPKAGQEALYSYLCREDENMRLPDRKVAACFSLELGARDYIRSSEGKLPMGFHAMYKYDPDLWMRLFPGSPKLSA